MSCEITLMEIDRSLYKSKEELIAELSNSQYCCGEESARIKLPKIVREEMGVPAPACPVYEILSQGLDIISWRLGGNEEDGYDVDIITPEFSLAKFMPFSHCAYVKIDKHGRAIGYHHQHYALGNLEIGNWITLIEARGE